MNTTIDISKLSLADFKRLKLEAIDKERKLLDEAEAELKGENKRLVRKIIKKHQPKVEEAKTPHNTGVRGSVRSLFMNNSGYAFTANQIAEKVGHPLKSVRDALVSLCSGGEVEAMYDDAGSLKVYRFKK